MRIYNLIFSMLFFFTIQLITLKQSNFAQAQGDWWVINNKATVLLFKNFDQINLNKIEGNIPTDKMINFSELLSQNMTMRGTLCNNNLICTFKLFRVDNFETGTSIEEAEIIFKINSEFTTFELISGTLSSKKI